MKEVIDRGWAPRSVITFQEQQALEFFEQGKSLMMRNWPYAWALLRRSPLEGKVGIVPSSIEPAMSQPARSAAGVWGLPKPPNIRRRQRSSSHSPSHRRAQNIHFRKGAVPARKSLFQDEEVLQQSPHYTDLMTCC